MTVDRSFDPGPVITPLGAGDLVDRAVRFYRQKFWTFILIATPPILLGVLILLVWTYIARTYFYVGKNPDAFANAAYYMFVWFGGMTIRFTEAVVMLSVMGGASRNFVRHLLFGEDLSFGNTYRYVWQNLLTLIASSLIVSVILGISGIVIFYLCLIVVFLGIGIIAYLFANIAPLAFLFGLVIVLGALAAFTVLFLLIASRFAYVPQSITVEGRGVVGAISRSFSLAAGNLRRVGALFLFTLAAIYSALAILYVPLAWYAWYEGVELSQLFSFDPDLIPAWYEIGSQLISQLSIILLTPVWTIGLCLLYVDERVRHEGYDIELMAAKRLGAIPDVPQDYFNPLQPALGKGSSLVLPEAAPRQPRRSASSSMLGLDQ